MTTKLKKGDIIKCDPLKIETKKDRKIKPVNRRVPIPIPIHLHKAANKELQDYLEAGIVEKCHHSTPWLSPGLFIAKKPDPKTGEVRCRLVADFSPVNRILLLRTTLMRVVRLISSR